MTFNAARDTQPAGRLLNRSPELAARRASFAETSRQHSTIYDWSAFSAAPAVQLRAFDDSCGDLHDAVAVGNHEVWGDPLPNHLSGGAVQLRERLASRRSSEGVHTIADQGLAGTPQRLPHADRIAASFGRHDVSGVQAHVDGAASTASRKLGAHGYASGNAVAFASSPDLFTAAHEAAHVVQQRAGVALSDGVGRSGDVYERHADEVATLVVRGASAESALDRMAGAGKGASPSQNTSQGVQLKESNATEELNDEETSSDIGGEGPVVQGDNPQSTEAEDLDPDAKARRDLLLQVIDLEMARDESLANRAATGDETNAEPDERSKRRIEALTRAIDDLDNKTTKDRVSEGKPVEARDGAVAKDASQTPARSDERLKTVDAESTRGSEEKRKPSTPIGKCYEPGVEQFRQAPESNQPKGQTSTKSDKADGGKADYSDADVADVKARWADEGSVKTASGGAARTPEFNRWHRRFDAALKAKDKNKVSSAERKAMQDWVKAYDARGIWELNRSLRGERGDPTDASAPPEPPQPGQAPASIATLQVNLGTKKKPNWKVIGEPPQATYGERTRYTVQVPGSNAEFRYGDHVQSKHTTRAEGVADSGKVKGGKQISRVFAGAEIECPDAGLVNRVFTELSPYEGGFDAINTYDAGHISVGFIQFITSAKGESHSLVQVLRDMKAKDPAMFSQYFRSLGIDVDGAGIVCVDLKTGKVLRKAEAVAYIISDKRLTAVFARAGREVPAFQHAQARVAYREYYRPDQRFSVKLEVKPPPPEPSAPVAAATDDARAEADAAPKGKKAKKAKKAQKRTPKKNTVTVSGLYGHVFRSLDGKVAITDRGIQFGTGGLNSAFKSGCQKVVDTHALTTVSVEDLAAYEAEIIPFVKNRHALGLGG